MTDETGFLQAIVDAPRNEAVRLIYADWLEERGDPRGEYLRVHCQLIQWWSRANQRADLLARALELRSEIDPAWLAVVRCCTTPSPPIDVERAIPALQGHAKTTVRLHPRRGAAAVDASKIGGVFLWPSELADAWPRCDEHQCPLIPALQLRKEDVPEIGFPPEADLFQVLWCPHYVHERAANPRHLQRAEPRYGPAPQIFWWKRSDIVNPAESHPAPATGVGEQLDYALTTSTPCVVYPERVTEYPDICELLDENTGTRLDIRGSAELSHCLAQIGLQAERHHQIVPGRCDASWRCPTNTGSFYQTWLSTADGTKVGGYPDWIHFVRYPRCSCGLPMELLINFASDEFDAVTWGRWLPIEERELLVPGNKEIGVAGDAPGWCFGDMGTLYLFICRHCEGRPTSYYLQTS